MALQDQEALPNGLRERVLARLGLGDLPGTGLRELRAAYRASCANVPFDNVRKMIALCEGDTGPLPGGDAADFFEHWLAHGTGGTCWTASNALYVLLRTLGFDARRVAGDMRDLGRTTHASVIVTVGRREWLVDASLQVCQPVPLRPEIYASADAVYPTEYEPVADGHLLWWLVLPGEHFIPCRIFPHERTHDSYVESYERSRSFGPFNQRLYARRSRPEELVVLYGNMRFHRTAAGVQASELSGEQLCAALREDLGMSEDIVERWRRSGALESTLQPPTGPAPDANPHPAKPPSQR